jgi:hypothetical protein
LEHPFDWVQLNPDPETARSTQEGDAPVLRDGALLLTDSQVAELTLIPGELHRGGGVIARCLNESNLAATPGEDDLVVTRDGRGCLTAAARSEQSGKHKRNENLEETHEDSLPKGI